MTKYEYIKTHANELYKASKKREKINESLNADNSYKRTQKLHAELSWICMEISKNEERLGFALGLLSIDELRDEYSPSGWHTYRGLKGELENLKFD